MDVSVNMIRFLLFMILFCILMFNLPSYNKNGSDDNEDVATIDLDYKKSNDIKSEIRYDSGFFTEKADEFDVYSDLTGNDNNTFLGLTDDPDVINSRWKNLLDYEKNLDGPFNYTTDDVDKLTSLSSDSTIVCLKSNYTCEEMNFEKCKNDHISTYIDMSNCLTAKDNMETIEYCLVDGVCNSIKKGESCSSNSRHSTKDRCEEANIKYCNIDNKCAQQYAGVDCDTTYQSMNDCKTAENITQDEGEYCLYENVCNDLGTGEICKGRFYNSLELCKSNNIEYCLQDDNTCQEIQKNDDCDNRYSDSNCSE